MQKNLLILFAVSLFILNFTILSHAGPGAKKEKKYKWEFSIAASLYYEPEDVIKDTLMISIPARIGYFLTRNIEIEPELNFILENSDSTLNSETKTVFLINLAYNFNTSSHIMPFFLFGAGIISYPPDAWIPIIEPKNITSSAFDAGAGIKWFVAKKVAMRIEYRFISYDGREATTRHNLFIGISIFL